MSRENPRDDNVPLAIGIALVCFLIFTCMDTIAKWLAGQGYPPLQTAFMRYGFHLLAALVFFLPSEGTSILRAAHPGLQALRAFLLLASTVLNFTAVKYLPLPVTISIFFATPLVVTLLSKVFLGEKVGPRRLAAIVTGFVGVLVITQPWSADFHPAMILGVIAMCCASSYFVLTRVIAGRDSNATTQLYAAGLAAVALAGPAALVWIPPAGPLDWALMVCIGLFGFLSHAMLTYAYRFAPASSMAPVVYSQMFYATVLSWIVFGVIPTLWTYVGAAIIIGSGLYIWMRERQLARPPSPLGNQKSATPPTDG